MKVLHFIQYSHGLSGNYHMHILLCIVKEILHDGSCNTSIYIIIYETEKILIRKICTEIPELYKDRKEILNLKSI